MPRALVWENWCTWVGPQATIMIRDQFLNAVGDCVDNEI